MYFRGTRGHNTVVVDELDQSHLMDERRVYRPARATRLAWESNRVYDFVDGVHNGTSVWLSPLHTAAKSCLPSRNYWVIVDVLTGPGRHTFDLYYHLMPGAQAQFDVESQIFRIEYASGAGLVIAPLQGSNLQWDMVTGSTNPIQGWTSIHYGDKVPSPELRLRRETTAPVQFCTVLYPYSVGQPSHVQVSTGHVEGRAADDPSVTAIRVENACRPR